MAATLSDIDHALKTLYPEGPAYEMMKESPLLALMKKDTKFVGRNKVVDIIYAGNQARSQDISKALTHGGKHKGKAFTITRGHNYAVFSVDREAMLATESDEGALVKLLATETDTAIQAFKNDLGNDLYGNGSGKRGQIATGGISTDTITLSEPNDVVKFEVGMKLVLSSTDGTGSVKAGTVLTVIAVDRDAGKVKCDAAITTAVATAAAGDYIFVDGDYGAKPKGLAAWLPSTAPTAGDSFFGVDRSADPTRLAGIRFDGSALNHEEALIKGLKRFGRDGAFPKHVVMHPDDIGALELLLGSKREYADVEGPAGIGFSAILVRGPKGKVQVFEDPWAPKSTAFALNLEHWEMASLKEVPHFVLEDGSKLDRQQTADGFDGRLAGYYQFICEAPGQSGRIALPVV